MIWLWVGGFAVLYIMCVILAGSGILAEVDNDVEKVDDAVGCAIFIPIINIFLAIYGIVLLMAKSKETYDWYNAIMECDSCGVYTRRGRAIIASNKKDSYKCTECGGDSFSTTKESVDLKLTHSPILTGNDIKKIKKGEHEIYNDAILKEQERRIREARNKKRLD